MTILEKFIHPHSLHHFFKENLFKSPLATPYGGTDFEGLISWELLESIFKTSHPNCWLSKEGALHPEKKLSTGVLNLQQAQESFKQGYSIVIRHSEQTDARLKNIAQEFEQIFLKPVDIQLYITPAQQVGFDWHYDQEEVFIIQSQGEKEFRLRPDSPTERGLEIRCHLKAGDCLYIPSGYWHKAQALTPSFHLSIGVMINPNNLVAFNPKMLNK